MRPQFSSFELKEEIDDLEKSLTDLASHRTVSLSILNACVGRRTQAVHEALG